MSERISPSKLKDAKFVGVYGVAHFPNQRLPIRELDGKHYNMFGEQVDLTKLVKRSEMGKKEPTDGPRDDQPDDGAAHGVCQTA